MDETDWLLLAQLQDDARLSFSELSRRVHMSPPAVAERVRRMEEAGVLTGYRAQVDPARVGWSVVAFIQMSCYGPNCVLRAPEVPGWPEVRELHRITGAACSLLKVAAPSMDAFEALIDRLAPFGQPTSTMVLSTPLAWSPITAPDPEAG